MLNQDKPGIPPGLSIYERYMKKDQIKYVARWTQGPSESGLRRLIEALARESARRHAQDWRKKPRKQVLKPREPKIGAV